MMRATNKCDVPGCGHTRLRLKRLCRRCTDRLPPEIRVGIEEAHRQRRWLDHAALKRRAATFLNLKPASPPAQPTVSPQRAYELQARLLGERTDA